MSARDRPVHDVLGRMSDDEGDDGDDVLDDLNFAFVPKSERLKRWQTTRPAVQSASSSSPPLQPSVDALAASAAAPASQRTETVYEQERNAKVRAVLAEQQRDQNRRGVFTLDLFDASLDAMHVDAPAFTSSADAPSSSYRGRRPYESRGGYSNGPNGHHQSQYPSSSSDGPRRYRMPNPNMTEEEQARYIRSRRNMAVTRNALREVDPETLEYVQVTQAPDQITSGPSGGGGSFGSGSIRGRGVGSYAGRGAMGYRGRGGEGRGGGRGRGYGGTSNSYRGGGSGGAMFQPFS